MEPEEGTEVPEIFVVSDAGEAPKWTWMAKTFRRSRRKSTRESGSGQKELTGLK